MRLPALIAALCIWAGLSHAATCERVSFEGNRLTLCTVYPSIEDLRLFWRDGNGRLFGHFSSLNTALSRNHETLALAMNGGMYHDDRSPVGHYVENGDEVMYVVPNAGPGNFGLLPNGVLCIGDNWARVIETRRFLAEAPECRHASQSGPMLVIDGKLHPAFLKDSTSRFIRNGVGTTADGSVLFFVISDNSVTFHEFARFFRDRLKVPQALFIDGKVSRLHAPMLNRSDLGRPMGPILGVVEPATN
jgi:uncharacterized protein YigE (DUF2233 family)